jgi:hypothetical protein
VQHLPRDPRAPSSTREERLIARAAATLREGDLEAFTRPDSQGQFPALVALFDSIDQDLRALSDTISYYYFSHAEQRVS